jgi:baculoviral IAP repeat-containing protein 6 (apollon)
LFHCSINFYLFKPELVLFVQRYVKCNTADSELALAFNYSLLQSLLDALPLTLMASSAGPLHWFFTLLNHVKCLDASAAAQRCTELLGAVAQQYHAVGGANNYHALLRSRYGLYGCPLDSELFDIDPPPLHTVPATSSVSAGSSYASIVASGISQAGVGSGVSSGPVGMIPISGMSAASGINGGSSAPEDVAFKDLMNLCWTDSKQSPDSQQMGRYLTGLLEVEPLHFTCHATSDGTRMERVDSGDLLLYSVFCGVFWL